MNGKYLMFYALIVAAMLVLLLVSLFDWRFLNADRPLKPTPVRTRERAPAPSQRRSERRPSSRDPARAPWAGQQSQRPCKTMHPSDGESISQWSILGRDSDYLIVEDEHGQPLVYHHDAKTAVTTGPPKPLNNIQARAPVPASGPN
jgi:hypothetical protein